MPIPLPFPGPRPRRRLPAVLLVVSTLATGPTPSRADEPANVPDNLRRENLVAWCIVPFDAAGRGPRERARMLAGLGLRRCAYDWREQHVSEFAAEIRAYAEHDIEFFAFWNEHREAYRLFREHDIRPQIWMTAPSPPEDATDPVAAAGRQLLPALERARAHGCTLGLYNHGGWGGEPENLVAVCRWLRRHFADDAVGIVYNLHHGHGHIDDFAACLETMKPYLLCLNLNGMNTGAKPKILPIGKGEHDRAILATLVASGYGGPVGIIDHRDDRDAEESLRENLDGLDRLLTGLDDTAPSGR